MQTQATMQHLTAAEMLTHQGIQHLPATEMLTRQGIQHLTATEMLTHQEMQQLAIAETLIQATIQQAHLIIIQAVIPQAVMLPVADARIQLLEIQQVPADLEI